MKVRVTEAAWERLRVIEVVTFLARHGVTLSRRIKGDQDELLLDVLRPIPRLVASNGRMKNGT